MPDHASRLSETARRDLLCEAGAALYGPHWQPEIGKALRVNERTIRRWVAGTDDVPDGIALDLWRLCEERALRLDAVRQRLQAVAAP